MDTGEGSFWLADSCTKARDEKIEDVNRGGVRTYLHKGDSCESASHQK